MALEQTIIEEWERVRAPSAIKKRENKIPLLEKKSKISRSNDSSGSFLLIQ